MKKKICNACNLEFASDLEKCPVCGKNLFDMVADIEVAAINQIDTPDVKESEKE